MARSKFDLIVWVLKTSAFHSLRGELLRLARDEPNESTEYEGMVDFHWGFAHLADAERMAAALSPLTSRPEFVLLRLSNYDNLDASITYKDQRVPRH
jgi:hypothetical protein